MRWGCAPGAMANQVLASLSAAELTRLQPHLTRVRLVRGQVLIESGQAAEHVFFIEDGVAALMAESTGGQHSEQVAPHGVQVAMIGREGMVGGLSLLDGELAAYACAVMQIPGPALRILATELRAALADGPALRAACLRAVQSLTRQIMGTAACNARGSLAERYVRWLLMADDRMGGDDLPVTHEALSAMLGVRRSGITLATAALQKVGLIRARRGRIRVLDRTGLEAAIRRGSLPDPVAPRPRLAARDYAAALAPEL